MVITDKFFFLSAQNGRRPAPPHNPHAAAHPVTFQAHKKQRLFLPERGKVLAAG